jgi:uncharacterized protein (DUF58 family)
MNPVPDALTFPLVPRWRPVGSPFGRLRAARRGLGTSVAGSRPYRVGDDPGAIDWKTSARLSSLAGDATFIVREHFADEAPRVVLVADRRPSMALYPPDLPWLSKPEAMRSVWSAIAAAASRDLGLAGYLDVAADGGCWVAPTGVSSTWPVAERLAAAPFDAAEDSLGDAFERLAATRRSLPPGTFVFVCSDFLAPPPAACWLRGLARRWDLVPVVIQEPRWEQSFPDIDSLTVPFADPRSRRSRPVRIRRGESAARRAAHERRLAALLVGFRGLGLDPVVIGSADQTEVLVALTRWAQARLMRIRGVA